MERTASMDDEEYPEMGLQFNPTQGVVKSESANSPPPTTESQEIVVGNAGKAILLGDEIDLESDSEDHPPSTPSSKSGIFPNWLQSSSSRMKGILGLAALLLLAFVAVMIVGVVQLSPSSTDKDGSDGGASGLESEQNTATDPTNTVPPPSPTPKPSQATTNTITSSPTQEIITIPISKSEVNVVLPTFLEMKLPDFSDGLDTTELENWNLIEETIESTISTSLSESLPADYSVESIQVDKFDGFVTSLIRKRNMREGNRHLQNDSKTIYAVLYSSSVTVSCLVSDCTTAPDVVSSATYDMSQMDYLRVSVETAAPITPVTPITDSPTTTPVASTPAPTSTPPTTGTNEPSGSPTAPTESPTKIAIDAPVTDSPTTPASLADRRDECNVYTPCEKCLGGCSGNDECEEGLLCFQRRGYQTIPGCAGPGMPGQNYCYDPFVDGLTEDVLLTSEDAACDKKDQCGKCKGDCDDDDDCEKNLFCYRRSEFEMIPGCAGQGTAGTDYCFDVADLTGLGDF